VYITEERGYNIGGDSLRRAGHLVSRFRNRFIGRAENLTQQTVQTALISGASFGFGVLGGHQGAVDVLGVPVDLGAGIIIHLGALAGLAGRWDKAAHDIGDGALAAYFARLGARVGHNWARKSPRVKGERMISSGERRTLTPGEVGAMAMAGN
jgi:hypothetical protein